MDNRINLKINHVTYDLEIKIIYRLLNCGFTIKDIDSSDYYMSKEDTEIKVCFENNGILCTDLPIDETVKVFNIIQDVINVES